MLRRQQLENWINATATATIILGSLLGLSLSKSVLAGPSNIVPDNTLGAGKNSIVTPNYQNQPIEVITGGAQNGQNLFHSFTQFNVSTGRGAYFYIVNPSTANVLVRVTGANISNINGTLGTFGNASPNLFLMNPNGIIFGSGASLDLGGAFIATTANAIGFGTNGNFSATQPQQPSPLLTIQPSALFINKLNAAATIVNESAATSYAPNTNLNNNSNASFNGLQMANGQSLSLIGGDVSLSQGGQITAPGGTIQLGGLSSNGTIGINSDGSLNYPTGVTLSNVTLSGGAQVNVASGGGGSITINANNVTLSGASGLTAGIASGQGNTNAQAGDITVNATGNIIIDQSSIIDKVSQQAIGNGGNININGISATLANSSQISTISYIAKGNGGNININLQDSLTLTNSSNIGTGSLQAKGNAGNININLQNSLTLDDNSAIVADTIFGAQGNSGDITINAQSVQLQNGSYVASSNISSEGDVGKIIINAQGTIILDDSYLETALIELSFIPTNAEGKGGEIFLKASSIDLNNNSYINSGIDPGATGSGGNININIEDSKGSFNLQNYSFIATTTKGRGNAGNITVNVAGDVTLSGSDSSNTVPSNQFFIESGISSQVTLGAVGNAGDITLTANNLNVTQGATIDSSTKGQGNAGNISVNVAGNATFSGSNYCQSCPTNVYYSGISSQVNLGAVGNAGNIVLTANNLNLSGGAAINSSTTGTANAGIITLNTNNLDLSGSARINSSTSGQGNAGDIILNLNNMLNIDGQNSGIFANTLVGSTGNGGSIFVMEPQNIQIQNTSTIAVNSAGTGTGGNIFISGNNLSLNNHANISAVTTSNNGGDINLNLTGNLSLQNNSNISSTAGTANAGGNGEHPNNVMSINT